MAPCPEDTSPGEEALYPLKLYLQSALFNSAFPRQENQPERHVSPAKTASNFGFNSRTLSFCRMLRANGRS